MPADRIHWRCRNCGAWGEGTRNTRDAIEVVLTMHVELHGHTIEIWDRGHRDQADVFHVPEPEATT